MEIVVFIAFLIVPIFTIVAFVMTLMLKKQVKALKELVAHLIKSMPKQSDTEKSFLNYELSAM